MFEKPKNLEYIARGTISRKRKRRVIISVAIFIVIAMGVGGIVLLLVI